MYRIAGQYGFLNHGAEQSGHIVRNVARRFASTLRLSCMLRKGFNASVNLGFRLMPPALLPVEAK